MSLTLHLFRRMLREEWRLHEELFGGRRFGSFPVVVLALAAGGFELLRATGTDFDAVIAGLHGLVFFFGLQVGTIGLVGRDALRDVLGDVTPLVFSARTLPLSWRRLLATFLLKDVCYYTGFVLTPAVVGYGVVVVTSGAAPASVALLWLAVVAAFAFGVSLSLALVAVATRSRPAVVGGLVAGTLAVVGLGADPVAYTPYALYAEPSAGAALRGVVPALALAAVGVALFRPVDDTGS